MSVLAVVFGVFMVASGITHFTAPAYYRRMIPRWLPAPAKAVVISGLADCAVGVLLLVPGTRAVGGWAAALLITAYLPAHLDGLRGTSTASRPLDRPSGVAARVLVNLGYITCAVLIAVTS